MEPFVWVKAKYLAPKTRGKYSGGSTTGSSKKRRHKNAKAVKPLFKMQMVLDLERGGKIRWEKVPV